MRGVGRALLGMGVAGGVRGGESERDGVAWGVTMGTQESPNKDRG